MPGKDSETAYTLLSDEEGFTYVYDLSTPSSTFHLSEEFHCDEQWKIYFDLRDYLPIKIPHDDPGLSLAQDVDLFRFANQHRSAGIRLTPKLEPEFDAAPFGGNMVDPTWLSINLGGKCDSRCQFCYTEWIRKESRLKPQHVISALVEATKSGVTSVVFTGGEPTLAPDLAKYISFAREAGFRAITIQTNGHQLACAEYTKHLKDSGLTHALVSLHGANHKSHDAVSCTVGSYDKAIAAIEHLSRFELSISVNFVVCKQNLHCAELLPGLCKALGVGKLVYSYWIIEGAAFDNAALGLVSYPEFLSAVAPGLELARQAELDIEVWNVPDCIAASLGMSPRYDVPSRRTMMSISPFEAAGTARGEVNVKLSSCRSCQRQSDCSGVQLSYFRYFPECDVKPIEA